MKEMDLKFSDEVKSSDKDWQERVPKIPKDKKNVKISLDHRIFVLVGVFTLIASIGGYLYFFRGALSIDLGSSDSVESVGRVLGQKNFQESEQDSTEDQYEQLLTDISLQYQDETIVLTSKSLENFLRDDCSGEGKCDQTPCVDVGAVRGYIDPYVEYALVGQPKMASAGRVGNSFKYDDSNYAPDLESAVEGVVACLTSRIEGYKKIVCGGKKPQSDEENTANCNTVRITKVEVPGTDGTYAPKYIELDDSQQHIYAWEDGEVVTDYEVSGFFDEYAVYGVFSVKVKDLNAWSPTAEKWMPFWMAFYYDPLQQAWFGIHELVYWYDEDGVKHEEPSDSIGHKKSAGCVRLDRGEAEELYNWAEVGDPVLIHR